MFHKWFTWTIRPVKRRYMISWTQSVQLKTIDLVTNNIDLRQLDQSLVSLIEQTLPSSQLLRVSLDRRRTWLLGRQNYEHIHR